MAQSRLDIAFPEVLTETEPDCEVEYQVNVRTRLSSRLNNGRAQLNPFAGLLIEPETDAQSFTLPAARYRQDNVGESGCRRQVEVGLNVEFELAQCIRASCSIGMRQ